MGGKMSKGESINRDWDKCPVCDEPMSYDWGWCPYDGTCLKAEEEE
jgi:hypothetical protein